MAKKEYSIELTRLLDQLKKSGRATSTCWLRAFKDLQEDERKIYMANMDKAVDMAIKAALKRKSSSNRKKLLKLFK